MKRSPIAWCLLALIALLSAPGLEAHTLGQTRVTARFTPDRTYTIDILVDPESLLAKLQILAGQEPTPNVPASELPPRISALRDVLLANTRVSFDGVPDQPTLTYIPGPSAAVPATSRRETLTATANQSRLPSNIATAPNAVAARSAVLAQSAVAMQSAAAKPNATAVQPAGAGQDAVAAEDASPPNKTPPPSPPETNQQGERVGGGVRGSSATATIRLSGRVPTSAREFQFSYGLVLGAFPLTVETGSAEGRTVWLTGGQESEAVLLGGGSGSVSRVRVAAEYLVLGFEHIVPKGLDHILFVLGIFLLSTAWRPILLQVTTFTIAHSITLGLTIYGFVSLPSAVVEPLIALSITYVAVENLFTSTLRPWRVGLVFAFGLLHGMGFAGVLKDLGLPRSEFLTALVTFNLGVEGGQLAVIAGALLAVGWWRRSEAASGGQGYRRWVVIPASLLIAGVGAYWTIARALGAG
jgi:hypothetical protein